MDLHRPKVSSRHDIQALLVVAERIRATALAQFNVIIYCNDKNAVGADVPEAMRIFRLGFYLIKPGSEN